MEARPVAERCSYSYAKSALRPPVSRTFRLLQDTSRNICRRASRQSRTVHSRVRRSRVCEESRCYLVATTTLEVGIDIGDVDVVAIVGAPPAHLRFCSALGVPVGVAVTCAFFLSSAPRSRATHSPACWMRLPWHA